MNIAEIENHLTVQLPTWYAEMLNKSEAIGGCLEVMSDPKGIIYWNNEYRKGFGGNPPWPNHLFCIGDDGAASCYAIDLTAREKKIMLLDHGNPRNILENVDDVDAWFNEIIEETIKIKNEKPQPISGWKIILLGAGALFILAAGLAFVISVIKQFL